METEDVGLGKKMIQEALNQECRESQLSCYSLRVRLHPPISSPAGRTLSSVRFKDHTTTRTLKVLVTSTCFWLIIRTPAHRASSPPPPPRN